MFVRFVLYKHIKHLHIDIQNVVHSLLTNNEISVFAKTSVQLGNCTPVTRDNSDTRDATSLSPT